ncbi:MAG: C25 family cysteine peptidase [Pseudomonadota bacterium]
MRIHASILFLALTGCGDGGSSPGDVPATPDTARTDVTTPPGRDTRPGDGAVPVAWGPENLLGGATLVILAHEDLVDALEPLAAWKNARGLPTRLVPLGEALLAGTGADQPARIRDWIRELRDTEGTRYVLLAGDTNLLPVRQVYQEMYNEAEDFYISDFLATDLYYGDLDGDWDGDGDGTLAELEDGLDLLPDVAVGRVPARTATEAKRWVDKVLAYERDPVADYQHKVLLLGEWAGEIGGVSFCSTTALDGVIEPVLPEHVEITKLYGPQCPMSAGAIPTSPQTQLEHMNAGQAWALNFGHGWLESLCQLGLSDMDALTTGDRPSIFLTTECNSCEFDFPTLPHVACEEYVLAGGGGVAYIGNTEFGVGAPWLMNWYRDFLERMYGNPGAALGDLMAETTRTFADPAGAQEPLSDLRWTYLVLILMGDPSLAVYTDRPAPLTVAAQSAQEALTVTVTADGAPVVGATVALHAGNRFLYVEIADEAGAATFQWADGPPAPPISLTVTAPNHLPFQETISRGAPARTSAARPPARRGDRRRRAGAGPDPGAASPGSP